MSSVWFNAVCLVAAGCVLSGCRTFPENEFPIEAPANPIFLPGDMDLCAKFQKIEEGMTADEIILLIGRESDGVRQISSLSSRFETWDGETTELCVEYMGKVVGRYFVTRPITENKAIATKCQELRLKSEQISNGMPIAEVVALLGRPDRGSTGGKEGSRWTYWYGQMGYLELTFDANGQVSDKRSVPGE